MIVLKLNCLKKETTGLAIVMISALISSSLALVDEIKGYYRSPDVDMVTSHEKRFAGLKSFLPARGVIGYIADQRSDDVNRDLFLAQYALAPVIFVRNERTHRYVVGDFYKPASEYDISQSKGFRILKKLDNGVMLLEME